MKRVLYAFYILCIIIVLIPKEKLFFTAESYLSEVNLFINGETLYNRFFYLDIENAQVMADDLEIGSIERIRMMPWVVFNQISITSVSLSPAYRSFLPEKVDEIVLTYSVLHPLSIDIRGKGDFGECRGTIDLAEQKIRVVFDATQELRQYPLLVFKLHKEKEGLVYESAF